MMTNPTDFLKTIYLGDRACKAILILSWDKQVKIQVDEISRIRSNTGKWDFYNDENIEDGYLVFDNVQFINLEPGGFVPNDFIHSLEVVKLNEGEYYRFTLLIGSIDQSAHTTEIKINIVASNIRLEDKTGHSLP